MLYEAIQPRQTTRPKTREEGVADTCEISLSPPYCDSLTCCCCCWCCCCSPASTSIKDGSSTSSGGMVAEETVHADLLSRADVSEKLTALLWAGDTVIATTKASCFIMHLVGREPSSHHSAIIAKLSTHPSNAQTILPCPPPSLFLPCGENSAILHHSSVTMRIPLLPPPSSSSSSSSSSPLSPPAPPPPLPPLPTSPGSLHPLGTSLLFLDATLRQAAYLPCLNATLRRETSLPTAHFLPQILESINICFAATSPQVR